jgi:hypothetical protein
VKFRRPKILDFNHGDYNHPDNPQVMEPKNLTMPTSMDIVLSLVRATFQFSSGISNFIIT